MKILIVCSKRDYLEDGIAPFIKEQVQSMLAFAYEPEYFLVHKKGIKGYLSELKSLKKKISDFQPNIIHAHYGLVGLLVNLQRKVPVVTTYHGSDINEKHNRRYSLLSTWLSKWNIFVSEKQTEKLNIKSKFSVIPCGADTNVFYPKDKTECRKQLGFDENKIYILFSKAFQLQVKNYPLAKAAVDKIENAELIELIGYFREEVNLLMNACDVALMTSFNEGSPQFIKEAMATNCPIVSTDVGDVRQVIDGVENCYISTYNADDVAEKIKLCLSAKERNSKAREKIMENYSLEKIAEKIKTIYEQNAKY